MLEHSVADLVRRLRTEAANRPLVLLDYTDNNADLDDESSCSRTPV
jgi:hypothetical protein